MAKQDDDCPPEDKPKGASKEKKKDEAPCEECKPWQKYIVYAVPLVFFIPWALHMMKCKSPKTCAQPSPCPPKPAPTCPPNCRPYKKKRFWFF